MSGYSTVWSPFTPLENQLDRFYDDLGNGENTDWARKRPQTQDLSIERARSGHFAGEPEGGYQFWPNTYPERLPDTYSFHRQQDGLVSSAKYGELIFGRAFDQRDTNLYQNRDGLWNDINYLPGNISLGITGYSTNMTPIISTFSSQMHSFPRSIPPSAPPTFINLNPCEQGRKERACLSCQINKKKACAIKDHKLV